MLRSFSDRVFSGVAGGLAAALRVPGWLVRALWLLLMVISGGAFGVPYVLLWWLTPPQSMLARRQRGLPIIAALLLLALTAGAWIARDQGVLRTAAGVDLFWYGAALIVALVFFARQLGGRGRAKVSSDADGVISSRSEGGAAS